MKMKWQATMSNDPWKDLAPPSAADAINAKRVSADLPWGFFWARSIDHRCLLLLQHSEASTPRGRLPLLKEIEVTVFDGNRDGDQTLVWKLLDSAHRDIFHTLCEDIVASASRATTEREAVDVALARTWRWYHLLRGGTDGRLSHEEQKGLIGELLVIENDLLPRISVGDTVAAWRGPLGAPKDFEIGRICVEAKARRGAATPYIAISSENQLDETGTDILFLRVVDLDQAPSDAGHGFSLSDIANRIRSAVSALDERAGIAFEDLLSAAGFQRDDDYSDSRWVTGAIRLYRVRGGFPRITAQSASPGVTNVKYTISLTACEPFRVEDDALQSALEGKHNGRH